MKINCNALTSTNWKIVGFSVLTTGDPVREFDSYLRANAARIPNYGERHRCGEAISSAFVESTVNQVVSKPIGQKTTNALDTRGAHLLLQVRTRVLNNDLADDFHRWYPNFSHTTTDQHNLAA